MVRGDGHDPNAPMGSWASHLCLGPGWSTTANTPFRYHKTWTHEGGTATPLIVHWPAGIKAAGEWRSQPAHVIDVWPTLCEIANAAGDETENPERPGISLLPVLQRDATTTRTLWWSHEGNRALRHGDWKISVAGRDGRWELYDLKHDRTETKDLADEHPEKLAELKAKWERLNRRHTERATSYD